MRTVRWRRLRRSPIVWWAAVALLSVATGTTLLRGTRAAEEAAARWGARRSVVVATTALDPGHVIGPGDVRAIEYPEILLPEATLAADPVGATVLVPVAGGAPVLASHLSTTGRRGIAALLPEGTVAIAVPEAAGLALRVGDRVDALATFDPESAGARDPTFAVARAALVIDIGGDRDQGDRAVTLAVAEGEAPRVAFALVHGVVTLVLVGP